MTARVSSTGDACGVTPGRRRLVAHWLDDRDPSRDRFEERRGLLEEVLSSEAAPRGLDDWLRERGTNLRCVARDTTPVFGSFFV